jgi:hypothetical protein
MSDIRCPFCGEDGFDLVGFKGHLERWCEEFRMTETPHEELMRKLADRPEGGKENGSL